MISIKILSALYAVIYMPVIIPHSSALLEIFELQKSKQN
jgi:hypothetical protein